MLIFLLHPRLYAHSFFNSKDIPFAAMLIIALYLANRAFRKDTLGAFLLCGIVVGLAINLRPFALMLLPMIPAMRALDLRQASGRRERKRILASAGIFAAAALATAYITHPYYWENPLRFIEVTGALSQHPSFAENLFMGEIYPSDAVPWELHPRVVCHNGAAGRVGAGRYRMRGSLLASNHAPYRRLPRPRNPIWRPAARLFCAARRSGHCVAIQHLQRLAADVFSLSAVLPACGGWAAPYCKHSGGDGYS